MTLTDNRVGWIITQDVRSQSRSNGEKRTFKYSDWGPDAALEMCNRVRDYASPIGGTMGDIYDKTPKDAISKIMLEDKVNLHLCHCGFFFSLQRWCYSLTSFFVVIA